MQTSAIAKMREHYEDAPGARAARGVTLPQNVCGWGAKVPVSSRDGILTLANMFKFHSVNSPFTL